MKVKGLKVYKSNKLTLRKQRGKESIREEINKIEKKKNMEMKGKVEEGEEKKEEGETKYGSLKGLIRF